MSEKFGPSHPSKNPFFRFWLLATPKLFEWFGWVAALGATQFVHEKTKSPIVLCILLLGYFALMMHVYAHLVAVIDIRAIKSRGIRESISGMIAVALTGLTGFIAKEALLAFGQSAL